ncbi:MAG: YlbF family regulator [Thermincola sp.]|jgi:cell fate (sporulation/competence/biofilm development) regulator YlbF (YheA/YmcA/DUF963 family)|nr:YlbF family regulator [Thermincola sp.]MDT3704666.1 YlbF family regulator [Thermincola sp.]
MSAAIITKANELAEALTESEELAAMRQAELVMNSDPEAEKIVTEFQEKQKQIYEIQMRGEELGDQDKKEIEAIEGKMSGNPSIKAYMEASDRFESLLRSVNMIITRALSGEEEQGCGCGSECGPSCGCN